MDKNKSFAMPRPVRPTSKRAIDAPSTSKKVLPKERVGSSRKSILPTRTTSNCKLNATTLFDETILEPDSLNSDVDAEIEYKKIFRIMMSDCLVEEKIKREETQMDVQMIQLAQRLQKTMEQLDKTNRRLKDINFVAEQKRLANLKNQDCSNFYNMTENCGLEEKINNLAATEESRLDNLGTVNVDFGYDNESGHKKLLDTVNDAIDGLESIKKQYNLNNTIFQEHEESHKNIEVYEKEVFDIDSLKSEFDVKFPKYSEKLLKHISDRVAAMMENDD